MTPRVRRLRNDYERLVKRFADWPVVQISGKSGMRAEFYRFS